MDESLNRKYRRNRLVLGGILGFFASLVLAAKGHPVLGVLCLFFGLISVLRAIFGGAPILGLLLTKVLGWSLILYPLVYAVIREFWNEQVVAKREAQRQSEERKVVATSHVGEILKPTPLPKAGPKLSKASKPAVVVMPDVESKPELIKEAPAKIEPTSVVEFEWVGDFIKHYRLAEQQANLDHVIEQYADTVDYFGVKRSRSWIQTDKAAYWKKWPARSEKIEPQMKVKPSDVDEFLIFFDSTFKNENPQSGEWISGSLSNGYTVVKRERKFFVTKQTTKVLKIEKGGREMAQAEKLPVHKLRSEESSPNLRYNTAVRMIEKLREAESVRNIEGAMTGYAQSVDYFGKKMSKEAIYRDKVEYFQEWPQSEDHRDGQFKLHDHGPSAIKVSFKSIFKVSNELEGTWRSGAIAHTFLVSDVSGKMLIVSQSGKVTNMKKSPQKK